ncbi:hypothetical protein GA0070216_11053 [Micromonospora matsumotoense]|uniref:DUF1542 domain-containing protein n=1 Tax=Micromonospora matsumotoense TaxID=121616 RepID=A0A1C4ZL91_9ACTN|nr:hypothetical protein [Micromonospora matsumotoense]SCF33586.1 hypothetical protein GA0070216_11053 [Micromonospora matsumotoense]
MEFLLVAILIALLAGGFVWWRREKAAREARSLADVRADAQRWYERLGGQVMNLHGDEPAVRQALVDAGERYNAAGSQLEQARTVHQFRLARETALEGLAYARAARVALGLDPGPELPPLAAAQGAGEITRERQVDVQGQTFKAGPQPGRDTPYYYPGGRYQGRAVPSGWYSTPWWKTALGAGVGVVGGMLIADALFSPAFADPGYAAAGGDFAGGDFGGDGGDFAGGDFGTAGDVGNNDFGTAGDFGGGDFGGGDFGGGDFGGGDF